MKFLFILKLQQLNGRKCTLAANDFRTRRPIAFKFSYSQSATRCNANEISANDASTRCTLLAIDHLRINVASNSSNCRS